MDEETLCHFLQLGKFIKNKVEKFWVHEADGRKACEMLLILENLRSERL